MNVETFTIKVICRDFPGTRFVEDATNEMRKNRCTLEFSAVRRSLTRRRERLDQHEARIFRGMRWRFLTMR